MAKKRYMTRAEYAKHRGCSAQIIGRYVKQKRLTLVKGKIDSKTADQELDKNIQIQKKSKLRKKEPESKSKTKKTVSDAEAFNKAKAKREKCKADLAELELQEKKGKLVSVDQVKKEGQDLYRRYRDQMLNVVIRATKKLLGETNEFKFRETLKKEIESAIKRID